MSGWERKSWCLLSSGQEALNIYICQESMYLTIPLLYPCWLQQAEYTWWKKWKENIKFVLWKFSYPRELRACHLTVPDFCLDYRNVNPRAIQDLTFVAGGGVAPAFLSTPLPSSREACPGFLTKEVLEGFCLLMSQKKPWLPMGSLQKSYLYVTRGNLETWS